MLKDGFIKTSTDISIGEGVFATELTNLFKRWRQDKVWGSNSLQKMLIEQVAKGRDDIVIIKIPTQKLNHDSLKIRSQNILFNWTYSDKCYKMLENIEQELQKVAPDQTDWIRKFIPKVKQLIFKTEPINTATHLTKGAPAKESQLFARKKEAIEYIYKGNIPISNTEKIGEVNIAKLRSSSEYDPTKPMRSIFTALLKGTPEVKGAQLLNC